MVVIIVYVLAATGNTYLRKFFHCNIVFFGLSRFDLSSTTHCFIVLDVLYVTPLSSTWPHLNSDVGLEEGEY